MEKAGAAALAGLLWLFSSCASAGEIERDLGTLWEALWHQSGTPTRLVRWEQDLRVRVHGVDIATHRQHTLNALRVAAESAGLSVTDVSDHPDAVQLANISVEITPDNALEDNQPCVTYLNFYAEEDIDSAIVQMRSRDAWRCAFHEAMHVMGVRGHPAGRTVLSYFPWRVDDLMPLDRVMLRAWYSPRMRGGMTPFEALPVLARELVHSSADPRGARQAAERFIAELVDQMRAFALGQGDVPAIIKRSGKATEEGIALGRSETSFFLGLAYLEGASVAFDAPEALFWLRRAANEGNQPAQARLGSFR